MGLCIQWNITGSILSVASEDGKIRLYKGKTHVSLDFLPLCPPADKPACCNCSHLRGQMGLYGYLQR